MAGMLDGKIALITGAGRGIGRATGLVLAREGARVVAADLSADGVKETVSLIERAGGQAVSVVADMTRPAEITAMVTVAIEAYGRLDCAFNNAGITGSQVGAGGKLTAEWPEEAFDKIIQVNLKGVWLCMKAELEQMIRQGGGSTSHRESARCPRSRGRRRGRPRAPGRTCLRWRRLPAA